MWTLLLVSCSDYELGTAADHAPGAGSTRAAPRPDDILVEDTDGSGDEPATDSGEELVDTDVPRDTGEEPVEPEEPDEPAEELADCEAGYYADYYNLPSNHSDIEREITGIVRGDVPSNHDWWDATWWVWRTTDPNLEFGTDWWPVDTGERGDPQYFAVHWHAVLEVTSGGTYDFELASDDDSWAYIDGVQVADLGGIHALEITTFSVRLAPGLYDLDLWFAERHTSDSGFWFRWDSPDIGYYACP